MSDGTQPTPLQQMLDQLVLDLAATHWRRHAGSRDKADQHQASTSLAKEEAAAQGTTHLLPSSVMRARPHVTPPVILGEVMKALEDTFSREEVSDAVNRLVRRGLLELGLARRGDRQVVELHPTAAGLAAAPDPDAAPGGAPGASESHTTGI